MDTTSNASRSPRRMPAFVADRHIVHPRRPLWFTIIAMVLLSAGLLGILVRVYLLQTAPPQTVARLIDSQRSQMPLQARRGALLDRHDKVLASTEVRWRLYVDPSMIKDIVAFPFQLQESLGYDPALVARALFGRYETRYAVIDPDLSEDRIRKLEQLDWPCLGKELYLHRIYPQGDLAGQLIGFTGRDGDGLEGVELRMDQLLAGHPGRLAYTRDAGRRPLLLGRTDLAQPRHGRDLRLSLDVNIQLIAQRQLEKTVNEFGAKRGQLIVMDPHTGEILAMANVPTFDPNQLASSTADQRRNSCVTDVFEPGSIFKPFVWAMITQARLARPGEEIACEGGAWRTPFGRLLHDAHGYGKLTWDLVLIKSSNIGMGKVAMRTSHAWLRQAVQRFGFGHLTGSGLPGEVAGLVTADDDWSDYTQTSVPMGQEIAVTPLQMMAGFSIIANGGLAVPPTIIPIDDLHDPGHRPRYERVLSQPVAHHTREVMRRVVTEGTGRRTVKDSPYEIFGKTGTAQVPDRERGGYKPEGYVASFVGGAPVHNPRIVVGCFIHEPDPAIGHSGGTVAGPPVRQVIEQTLAYLGVGPDDR